MKKSLENFFTEAVLNGIFQYRYKDQPDYYPSLVDELTSYDPLVTASLAGSLLLIPELQCNCFRLEMLVHLALIHGKGNVAPNPAFLREAFRVLGDGPARVPEDPAEDVFTTSVSTRRGNFLVLEGIWEGAGFYLQRFLNIVDRLSMFPEFQSLDECIHSLLWMSDKLCKRAGLQRYEVGSSDPKSHISDELWAALGTTWHRTYFSNHEIETSGIEIKSLSPFILTTSVRNRLATESTGNSSLERCPLAQMGDGIAFLLPTAVSAAIRRLVIEKLSAIDPELAVTIVGEEYQELFASIPILGGSNGAEIELRRTEQGLLGGVSQAVDTGRHINLIFLVDTLEGFENGGLYGCNPDPRTAAGHVNAWIDHTYAEVSKRADFVAGISLIILCGVGRGQAHALNRTGRKNWRVEAISASDFHTLCRLPNFNALSLFRLLDGRDAVRTLGVELQNLNGLLNLIAWNRALDGHLVDHGEIPSDFVNKPITSSIAIPQNGLLQLRADVSSQRDSHRELNTDGDWISVSKPIQSVFPEDNEQPLYIRDDGGSASVYVTNSRPWWCDLLAAPSTPTFESNEHLKMMTTWLAKAAPILDSQLTTLPAGPIQWLAEFDIKCSKSLEQQAISYSDIFRDISVAANPSNNTITINVGPLYEQGLRNVANISERAVVRAFVTGAFLLAKEVCSDEAIEEYIDLIIPDTTARQTHVIFAQEFRDFVRPSAPFGTIFIDNSDEAVLRLNLGWQVRDKNDGPDIVGKTECAKYLKALVENIETQLCSDLKSFNRGATISALLHNQEIASIERRQWELTMPAVLSLRTNREAALETISRRNAAYNGVMAASRLLIEFAVCECAISGGRNPGKLDISRLMAKSAWLFEIGNWSGAIRWEAMEPRLRITPLGDVHANFGFVEEILTPFGRSISDARVQEAVEGYASNLEEPSPISSVEQKFEPAFLAAWMDEVGVTIDEMRQFVDLLEDMGIATNKAIFAVRYSRLRQMRTENIHLDLDSQERIIEYFSMKPRPEWNMVPSGFDSRDVQTWRFRKKLSVVRKPLIHLDDSSDPMILVSPAIVREAFGYTLRGFYRGLFPEWQLKPLMTKWSGNRADKRGAAFSKKVSELLQALGWLTDKPDTKVTKILDQGFNKNYGDVDVLAWDPKSGRVLIIECKDVQYKKTLGEIAEQLSDFRGEVRENGKADYLLLHLNRVDLIRAHQDRLSKYLKLSGPLTIESHLVFRNPVPMRFALDRLSEKVTVQTFDEIRESMKICE